MKIVKFVAHNFRVGDVEDPDLHAGEKFYNWEKSEAGKYVMNNSVNVPVWDRDFEVSTYSYRYRITAEMSEDKLLFYKLKYE